MTSLKNTLEKFHNYILEKDNSIEKIIVGTDEDFKHARLGVYQDAYFLRLLEILSKGLPAVKLLAGADEFEELGYDYIRNFPSHSYSVRYFGQHFAKYLANKPDVDPVWAEMATFELALEDVTDGRDAPQLTFEDMAKLSPESWGELKLVTHPSLIMLPFHYPIPTLWQALIQQKDKPELVRQEQPTQWILWRFNRQSYFRPMNAEQVWMMQAIQRGQTFSQVCEGLCEWLDEEKVIPFAAETLRQWITEGIFSEFQIAAS